MEALRMEEPRRRALVIGAGPSGIVAAKYMLAGGEFEVSVYEQGASIGGTFVNKTYDNTTLVSSKYITLFADLRCPPEESEHMTSISYVEYLKRYCDKFALWPHIQFGKSVTRVRKDETSGTFHVAHTDSARPEEVVDEVFDYVVVCSGLHNVPKIPHFDGIEGFPGKTLHSSEYKEPSLFRGKRVLVIGSGETAMDISYRAVRQEGSTVALATRHGFLNVPAVMDNGKPLDIFISNIFEHSHEHPWVHAWQLKWKLSTWVIRAGFLVATGSSWGWNQWACRVNEVRRGYHIINKSGAAMPYISRGHKQNSWVGKVYSFLDADAEPRDKIISTHGGISHILGSRVHFVDGSSFDADILVMCTGYRQYFPFLQDSNAAKRQQQISCGEEEDALPSWHHIIDPAERQLAFIGFVRPNVGAIPPMSEMQVMWWLRVLAGDVQGPLGPPSYHVLARKYAYGVDYGNYMHRLAEEIGAAPSLMVLLRRSWKICFSYCMGQAMVPFFKLQGPFACEKAWAVCEGEMWHTIVRRGLPENVALVLMVGMFAGINAAAWLADASLYLASFGTRRMLGFAQYT